MARYIQCKINLNLGEIGGSELKFCDDYYIKQCRWEAREGAIISIVARQYNHYWIWLTILDLVIIRQDHEKTRWQGRDK